jgi:thiamine-phosphate pyrophosphorylase
MSADLAPRLAVYLVADPDQTSRDLVAVVDDALMGGVTSVQLRAKRLTDREALVLARLLARRCEAHGALFIVNDRLDLALAAGAGGIHLGVDDLPIEDARRLAGERFVIGFSPDTDEQAAQAGARGADYLGVGPVFGTVSKDDAGAAIGLGTLSRRANLAGIPIIGIGGITPENAAQVVQAGAVGVAVVGTILRADDPRRAARQLSDTVTRARID